MKQEIGGLAKNDEEVLIFALFPQVGKIFLEGLKSSEVNVNDSKQPIKIFAYTRS